MHELDYIIPLYKPDKYRLNNLDYVENHFLKKQRNVKINLLVEEQDPAKVPVFNKSWLINKAIRHRASTDNFFVADVDVYSELESYFVAVLNWAERHKYRWCFGWSRLLYEGRGKDDKLERFDWAEPAIQEGGIVLFKRDLWDLMGGANEFIRELRGPDNDTAMRARYLTGCHVSYGNYAFHRWHPHSKYKKTKYRKHNRKILDYTRKHPEEVIDLLRGQDRGNLKHPYCDKGSFYECRSKRKK